jgi:hypothetical protein
LSRGGKAHGFDAAIDDYPREHGSYADRAGELRPPDDAHPGRSRAGRPDDVPPPHATASLHTGDAAAAEGGDTRLAGGVGLFALGALAGAMLLSLRNRLPRRED